MDLEKKLKDYHQSRKIIPNEQKVTETIRKSIDVYCSVEQERLLTYREFLWTQLRLIRKRWWLIQLLLLILLWAVLPSVQAEQLVQRILGVAASLFIILIIPELWKNQTCQSMEIEAASYYSLRQIYAARMLLFGIVDIVLITFFCVSAVITMGILLSQLLIQFIFPMTVTTAICFGILCSKHSYSETTAIMLCILWSSIWLVVILNKKIYTAVTFPLWLAFVGIAFVFFAFTTYRMLHCCNHYWEVKSNEIRIR